MDFYKKLLENRKFNNPMIMGVLNLTPDSFYDGGRYNDIDKIMSRVKEMIQEGVDIIDLGACSSRPGSSSISLQEERERLFPALKKIREEFNDIIISIDTYRYQIAEKAIKYRVSMINDIYVEKNETKMFKVIKKHNIPYVLMHMSGNPKNMQKNISYDNFYDEIMMFFENKIQKLNNIGCKKIILDPGFGFGKTLNQNYKLIDMIPDLKKFGCPILIGISRKTMISKPLKIDSKNTLSGTIAANTICLVKGANIIRVHDVKEAKETIEIFKLVKNNTWNS